MWIYYVNYQMVDQYKDAKTNYKAGTACLGTIGLLKWFFYKVSFWLPKQSSQFL